MQSVQDVKYSTKSPQSPEDRLILALKDVASYLSSYIAQTGKMNPSPPIKKIRSIDTQSGEFSHSGEVEEAHSTEIEQLVHVFNDASILFEKADFALPYGNLGWFSKAVEAAMDGSLYVGIALIVMYITAMLLSGALSFVGDTCFICALLGYVAETEMS